jgi:hypothetical protein
MELHTENREAIILMKEIITTPFVKPFDALSDWGTK